MGRRPTSTTVKCAVSGCRETALFRYDSKRELHAGEQERVKRPWKCLRHNAPEKVLTPDNRTITTVLTNSRAIGTSGIYWGGRAGFVTGEGFLAWSEDFPEGTKLRITAEIILPDAF